MSASSKTTTARELEIAGSLSLAFANTGAPTRDDRRRDRRVLPPAPSYGWLVNWAQRMGTLKAADGKELLRGAAARPQQAAAALDQAIELREALLGLFTHVALRQEPEASDLEILNRRLEVRQVAVEADGFGWLWQKETESLDRMLWPIAQSAADLLTSDKHRKIRQCGTQGCFRLFVYRNRRRVWCDANTCGNRDKGRRYQDMWRRADQYLKEKKRRESARRIAEHRRQKAAQGEIADFDREDPEFGVWSDAWSESLEEPSAADRDRKAPKEPLDTATSNDSDLD